MENDKHRKHQQAASFRAMYLRDFNASSPCLTAHDSNDNLRLY